MIAEIEQIVSSDEAARTTLQQAELEAEKMKVEAQEKAEFIRAALDKQIQEVEDREITPVLQEARRQAHLTNVQADQYIENLKKRLTLLKTKIADDYIDSLLNRNFR
jgi:glutamyl-tRNA reductase